MALTDDLLEMINRKEAKFVSDNARDALDMGEEVVKGVLQEALIRKGVYHLPELSPNPTAAEIAGREALCEHLSQQSALVAAAEKQRGVQVSLLRDKGISFVADIAKAAGSMLLQAAVASKLGGK